ncbi:MAG: hypothetical protein AAF616_05245 [Bacteroidota bacterium]
MKRLRVVFLLCSTSIFSCSDEEISTPALDSSPQFRWANSLEGPGDEDEIDAVASDGEGNVYLSGKFESELLVEGQPERLVSNGMADIMVVKYNQEGIWQWTRQFGGLGEDNIFDADCDSKGNLILSGYFQGSVQFGGFALTSRGGFDMLVLKISPDGEVLNAVQLGGTGNDGGNELEIGNSDQVIIGAQSDGNFERLPNTGLQDAYIISMTSDFSVSWIRSVEGAGIARAKAVETDDFGNVYLGGDYVNDNSISNAGTVNAFKNSEGADAYLASWSANGNLRWVKNWGGTGSDLCKGIVTTSQNDIYVVGQFTSAVDFDDSQLVTDVGTQDLFIWMLENDGSPRWLRQIKASENLTGAEVTIDDLDNLYFGLGISGVVDFQSNETDFESISSCGGKNCPVLIQYSANGNFITHIQADQSQDARFGELSFSQNTIFIDCVFTGGQHSVGNSLLQSQNGTKDAAIVAISLSTK